MSSCFLNIFKQCTQEPFLIQKKNFKTFFQTIFSTDFTQFIYTNYDFFLIFVVYRSYALNGRPSNLLYYGNFDAISDGSNIENTRRQSITYIFLFSFGLENELWEESR
jgi:hypothetical protein